MEDITQKLYATDRATLPIHEMTHVHRIGPTSDYYRKGSAPSSWNYKLISSLGPEVAMAKSPETQ